MVLRFKQYSTLCFFIFFSIVGIFSFYTFNMLNVKFFLEILLFIFILSSMRYMKKKLIIFSLLSLFYLIYAYIFVIISHGKISDYIYI
jgi:hypothetical protein